MEYRYLGRTGVRVSPLTLGCMMFGGKTAPDDSYAVIDRAIDAGINLLDTANVYVDGRSEEVTGEALKRNGLREHVFLATKCHGNMFKAPPPPEEGAAWSEEERRRAKVAELNPNQWGNSRRQIVAECERSLRRLQTDHVDLLQMHRPHPDCAIDETLRALDDLVTSGKVRYVGCSTFAAWQLVESLWVSEKLGLNRFVTEQPPYHLLDRRIERELLPACRTYGFGVIPWSPLAGGFLTGKYRRGDAGPEGSRFGGSSTHGRRGMLENDRVFDVLEALEQLARDKGCTVSQLALAWCMHQPGITSPILGPRTMEQLEDNLGALDVEITDEDREKIDEITPPGACVQPFYQAQFGPHPHRV